MWRSIHLQAGLNMLNRNFEVTGRVYEYEIIIDLHVPGYCLEFLFLLSCFSTCQNISYLSTRFFV